LSRRATRAARYEENDVVKLEIDKRDVVAVRRMLLKHATRLEKTREYLERGPGGPDMGEQAYRITRYALALFAPEVVARKQGDTS